MSPEPAREERPRRRRPGARRRLLGALVIFVALLEVVARLATRTAPNGMPAVLGYPLLPYRPTEPMIREWQASTAGSTYVVADAELGWCVGASGRSLRDDGSALYTSNAQGVRAPADRSYAPQPAAGRVRVLTVGDSFTHCDDVPDDATWQVALEAARPELEVVNLGVPGYGTDQALLRWRRDGRRFQSQLVVLGIWPENMCRNLNLIRYYLVPSEGFLTKPRLRLEGGALATLNSPVLGGDELVATLTEPETHPLLADERWYLPDESRPSLLQSLRSLRIAQSLVALYGRKQARERMYSGEDRSAIELTAAIAESFAREVREAGSTPLVLIIPMRELLAAHTAAQPFPLVVELRARGLDVLDLGPTFGRTVLELGNERMYVAQGHYTAEGNRLLAAALEEQLRPWIEAAPR